MLMYFIVRTEANHKNIVYGAEQQRGNLCCAAHVNMALAAMR